MADEREILENVIRLLIVGGLYREGYHIPDDVPRLVEELLRSAGK